MVSSLSSQDIAQYRSQLSAFDDAQRALDAIEDCEGDLEDAAISLAIHIGQQPDRPDWLDGLAKRCRAAICTSPARDALDTGNLAAALAALIEADVCPALLLTPVMLYAIRSGLEQFCEPLGEKLV
jgi:hypothetical protein